VKDILVESPKRVIWDACAKALHWKGNKSFREIRDLVAFLYLRTIEEGGELGRGPGGREYNACRPSDLTGPMHRSILPPSRLLNQDDPPHHNAD
jgi:hypothetical protein